MSYKVPMSVPAVLRLLALLTAGFLGCARAASLPPLTTVQGLDLDRYLGTWHEIARLPMFFQRNCQSDVTATYRRKGDRIEVFNRCLDHEGNEISATGQAEVGRQGDPAKLRVSFFWPFWADYWVLALGANYEWALVGEPDRDYLWLLARDPVMPREKAETILAIASKQGYDLGKLIWTESSASIKESSR